MSLRELLTERFDHLIVTSAAQPAAVLDLLEQIGLFNGGLVAPSNDSTADERHFADRVQQALDRQALYYANVISGRRTAGFLGQDYVDELRSAGELIEDTGGVTSPFLRLRDPDSVALVADPTAVTYFSRFLKVGRTLATVDGEDAVLAELQAIRDRLQTNAHGARPPVGYATTFMQQGLLDLRERAENLAVQFRPASQDRVAVMYNHVYFDQLLESIAAATTSIAVLMFYFPYDGRRRKAVTTAVAQALIEAHIRGVEVDVVLDRDREDQKYGTRHINANTIRVLRAAGIDARFDSAEQVTHSKIVTIDDQMTFLGTHNLSNSANYLYEEISLLVWSSRVAKHYRGFIQAVA